jgi:hypothetical protein
LIASCTPSSGFRRRLPDAPGEGTQQSAHGLGLFGHEFRRDHDGVAVELDAIVGHLQHDDVLDRHAARLQIDVGGIAVAEGGIDLAGGQHRLAHGEADILQPDLAVVELGEGLEQGPLREGGIGGRGTEFLTLQALRVRRDAAALATDDRE